MAINLLRQASDWLETRRGAWMAQPIVYEQGGGRIELAATIGRTEFEIDDGAGALVRVEARDFLVSAADLVLAGAPVLPDRGDRIRETGGDKVYVYEVMAPGGGVPWRWSDPWRRTLRIHTRQVETEGES